MRYQDRKHSFSFPEISTKLSKGSTSTLKVFGLSLLTSAVLSASVSASSVTSSNSQLDSSQPRLLAAMSVEPSTAPFTTHSSVTREIGSQTSSWFQGGKLSESGTRLWNAIRNADRLGIDPNRLHFAALESKLSAQKNRNARQILEIEHLLDSSFTFLVTEVTAGRVSPKEAQRYWFDDVAKPDTKQLLDLAKSSPGALGNVLADIVHNNRNVEPLLNKIAEYRAIEAAGGWPTLTDGPTIEPGDTSPRVVTLRQRLAITGDLSSRFIRGQDGTNAEIYSEELQQAVERFQSRHGLLVDRLVGRGTRAALNVTVTERIEQMQLNVERHRWLPNRYASRHIITNIPDYKLRVVEHGSTTLEMPVVVGKPKHQTPVFSEDMQFLVVNPTWTVPRSIANKELVPKELNNPGSLQASGFHALAGDGSRIPIDQIPQSAWHKPKFPYTLRQGASKRNALGKVKFMMPNKYAIYLHDTPAKKLFAKQRRAYSHGCVRLGDPMALANHLLGSQGWSQDRIDNLFAQQKTKRINLDQPIPNHIVYLTSWVNDEGTIQFRNDIYKLDRSLKIALAKESEQRQQLISNFSQFQPVLASNE